MRARLVHINSFSRIQWACGKSTMGRRASPGTTWTISIFEYFCGSAVLGTLGSCREPTGQWAESHRRRKRPPSKTGARLERSEALKSARHCVLTQSHQHHAIDRPRGEAGITAGVNDRFEKTKKVHCQSDNELLEGRRMGTLGEATGRMRTLLRADTPPRSVNIGTRIQASEIHPRPPSFTSAVICASLCSSPQLLIGGCFFVTSKTVEWVLLLSLSLSLFTGKWSLKKKKKKKKEKKKKRRKNPTKNKKRKKEKKKKEKKREREREKKRRLIQIRRESKGGEKTVF